MKPEEQFRAKIDLYFQKYFYIQREVVSLCGNGRLDYVLHDKESDAVFGVEVKKEEIKRGMNFGNYAIQASRYTDYEWKHNFDAPQKMLIFIAPSLSSKFIEIYKNDNGVLDLKKHGMFNYYRPKHEIDNEHHNLHSLFSTALKIGEIKTINKGQKSEYFAFLFKSKAIWRSCTQYHKGGLHIQNYNHYMNKLLKGKL
jgi:hypothetical protein